MLARQLLIGFLAVIVPSTVLLSAVTYYSLASLDSAISELAEIIRSREAVTDLNSTLVEASAPLVGFLVSRDPANRERFERLIRTAESKLQSCAGGFCHYARGTPARMAAALRPAVEQLRREGRAIFEADVPEGVARVEAARQGVAGVLARVEPMLQAVRDHAAQDEKIADAVRRRAWVLTVALTMTIALAGAAAAMLTARRIARPLNDLLLGIRRVMTGDWSHQVRTTAAGEIAELGAAFNAMVREVRERRAELEEHTRTLEERVRRRTEELRQKEQALVQSEKLASLGLLAAGVAHELNNPLTSIVMNTHLALEEVGAEAPIRAELRKIDADAGRCRRIVEDLRAFAHVRQVERVPTAVDALVEQALASTAHDVDRWAVSVRRELAPGLPKVPCDPARLVQVLVNLLANAAYAAGEGGRVVVRARREDAWLAFEVEDDGPGIPAALRSKIYDPFFTTKPDGTGLGLSISHGIVSEHGGRMEVESLTREDAGPDGRTGTTVRVLVPVDGAEA